MATRLPPIGFWSYARQDDDASRGRLSSLRSLLMSELQQQYGKEPIKIFQDVAAIPPGAQWEDAIRVALDQSTFFIPIITPAFIESEWCVKEVALFMERERAIWRENPALAGKRRIFPIYYIGIDEVDPFDPAVLTELKRLQWVNFTSLRHRNDSDEAVKDILSSLAGSLCHLMRIRVPAPPTEAQKAADLRQRQLDEDAAAEARRAAEAARRAAEAEAQRRVDEAAEQQPQGHKADLKAANEAELKAAAERKRAADALDPTKKDRPPLPPPPPPYRAIAAAVAGVILILVFVILASRSNPSSGDASDAAASDAAAAASDAMAATSAPASDATQASSAPAQDVLDAEQALVGRWRPNDDADACTSGAGVLTVATSGAAITMNGYPAETPTALTNGWLSYAKGLWRVDSGMLQAIAPGGDASKPALYAKCG